MGLIVVRMNIENKIKINKMITCPLFPLGPLTTPQFNHLVHLCTNMQLLKLIHNFIYSTIHWKYVTVSRIEKGNLRKGLA